MFLDIETIYSTNSITVIILAVIHSGRCSPSFHCRVDKTHLMTILTFRQMTFRVG